MESFKIIEIVAVVFGVLSVWYAHKENIWVFPLVLSMCLFTSIFAFQQDCTPMQVSMLCTF